MNRYADYMASDEWTRRRDHYLLTHEYACHRCNAHEHLELHHRTYERLGRELDSDLCWLCQVCHSIQHKLVGTLDPGEPKPRTLEQQSAIEVATRAARVPVVERHLLASTSLSIEDAQARARAIVYGDEGEIDR